MADQELRTHACPFCGRCFSRNEHLVRHCRIHTQEKPFACEYCPQRFSRSDLQRRHTLNYHSDVVDPEGNAAERLLPRHDRARIACDNCNRAKVKCTSIIPCGYCVSRFLECRISESRLSAVRDKFPPSTCTTQTSSRSKRRRMSRDRGVDTDSNVIYSPQNLENLPESDGGLDDGRLGVGNPTTEPCPDISVAFDETLTADLVNATQMSYDRIFQHDDFSALEHIDPGVLGLETYFDFDKDWLSGPLSNDDALTLNAPRTEPVEAFHRFRQLNDLDTSRAQSPSNLSSLPHFASAPSTEDALRLDDTRDVLDEFIILFETHVSPWLDVFEADIVITPATPQEWYLALAAVGGLFSSAPGAAIIAKWLYNKARYKSLTNLYTRVWDLMPREDKRFAVETTFLLAIFGYLAGDKRTYELNEVQHAKMVEIAQTLMEDFEFDHPDERIKVMNTLALFECYRVALTQRPGVIGMGAWDEDDAKTARALLDPEAPQDTIILSRNKSLSVLCCLATLTWSVAPSGSDYPIPWSTDFFELGLHRWYRAHETGPSPDTTLLFHGIHLNMLVCLAAVQNYVVTHLRRGGSDHGARHGQEAAAAAATTTTTTTSLFVSETTRSKAVFHARMLIEEATGVRDDAYSDGQALNPGWRPLHFSHLVCSASLVLWCHGVLGPGHDTDTGGAWLQRGISLLESGPRDSPPRVAKCHKTLLEDLVARTNQISSGTAGPSVLSKTP